jgi:hypothetical protein
MSEAGCLPKSKYAERVAAKHAVNLYRRFIPPRPERKEDTEYLAVPLCRTRYHQIPGISFLVCFWYS